MRILNKYVAILMVVGFSLPTIFQSIHVIEHQSRIHNECEHNCSSEESQNTPQDLPGIVNLSVNNGSCAICSFHLNDLKFSERQLVVVKYVSDHTNILEAQISLHSYYKGLNKLLRGPPLT